MADLLVRQERCLRPIALALLPSAVVQQGLQPGDTVVTDGFMMLFPGAQIRPVEGVKPLAGQS